MVTAASEPPFFLLFLYTAQFGLLKLTWENESISITLNAFPGRPIGPVELALQTVMPVFQCQHHSKNIYAIKGLFSLC